MPLDALGVSPLDDRLVPDALDHAPHDFLCLVLAEFVYSGENRRGLFQAQLAELDQGRRVQLGVGRGEQGREGLLRSRSQI